MIEYKLLDSQNMKDYIQGIQSLNNRIFNAKVTRRILEWRYLENPIGETICIVALDNEKVIGFIGSMPHFLNIKDNQFKTAMITNVMTDPNYSNQGVFQNLLSKLEKQLGLMDYYFVYSFPNHLSNRLFIQYFNWKNIYEIPRLEITRSNLENRNQPQYLKKSFNNLMPDTYYKDLTEKNLAIGEISFDHSSSYRIWRIKNKPQENYENYLVNNYQSGYITLRTYKNELNIVDWKYSNIETFKMMLEFSLKKFYLSKYDKLTAWSHINTQEHLLLQKYGFANNYPIAYFAGKLLDTKIEDKIYFWNNWYLTPIDNNIY